VPKRKYEPATHVPPLDILLVHAKAMTFKGMMQFPIKPPNALVAIFPGTQASSMHGRLARATLRPTCRARRELPHAVVVSQGYAGQRIEATLLRPAANAFSDKGT
jgi:hypothetical protein